MSNIRFVWDSKKNIVNKRKHGVSFEEAQTVFYDEYAKLITDPDHSEKEDHFIILGRSIRLRILVVCHCYREDDEVIRIISARRANKFEQGFYKGRPMRKQYDFSKAQPNPYVGKLKKQITIRLEPSTIDYFKGLAKDMGIPYQNLINLYLRDCALAGKRPSLRWN